VNINKTRNNKNIIIFFVTIHTTFRLVPNTRRVCKHAWILSVWNTGFFPRNIIQHSSEKLRKFIQKVLAPNEMKNANASLPLEQKYSTRLNLLVFSIILCFKSIMCKGHLEKRKGYKFNWPKIYVFLCLS